MKTRTQEQMVWSYLAILLVVTASAGCRSGKFSMPGKNLFSWSRQPDASTLAGNTQVPNEPLSPAAKYDPAAMAAMGSKPTNGSTTGAASGSAYGFSPKPGTTATTGLAATANGYQTGPYQVTPKPSAATSTVASTAASAGLPNPYGGTYGGTAPAAASSTSSQPDNFPLPSSVAAAMSAGSAATANGQPAYPTNATPVGYTGASSVSVPSYQTQVSTPAVPSNNFTAPTSPSIPAYPSFPNMNLPSGSAGTLGLSSTAPANPTNQSSTTTSSQPAATSSSAYMGSTTLNGYSPGSTGRNTAYDFSSGNNAAMPAATTQSPSNTGSLPLLR